MKSTYLCVLALASLSACASPADVGTFEMPLVANGSSGVTYRLRNATFVIRDELGADVASLSGGGTELELQHELVPGSYTVTLEGEWSLRDEATAVVVDAVLVSDPQQAITVVAGDVTDVVYRFSLDDDAVSFGHGRVDIGIAVEEAEEPMDITLSWTMNGNAPDPTNCGDITEVYAIVSRVGGDSQVIPAVPCWAGSTIVNMPAGDYRTVTFFARYGTSGSYVEKLEDVTFSPDGATSATADFPFNRARGIVWVRYNVGGVPWTAPGCDAGGDVTVVGPVVMTSGTILCGSAASLTFLIVPPGEYMVTARRYGAGGDVVGIESSVANVAPGQTVELTMDFPAAP